MSKLVAADGADERQQPPIERSEMERMSSSLQSWVEDHKLSTIGGVWATAVGASVASSRRRRSPARGTGIHAQVLTLAVLGGGAALAHHYYGGSSGSKKRRRQQQQEDLDFGFYSQLPPATDADGNENERWSW